MGVLCTGQVYDVHMDSRTLAMHWYGTRGLAGVQPKIYIYYFLQFHFNENKKERDECRAQTGALNLSLLLHGVQLAWN